MTTDWPEWMQGLGAVGVFFQIVGVNLILSGDNAVVIALACRGLPPAQRRLGLVLGASVAILMRLVFTFLIVFLLGLPFLRVIGGLLLLWIAVKLIVEDDDQAHGSIAASDRLWNAVRTVAVADVVMSLDNVLAIAGIAQNSYGLVVLGLAISIPLIVAGASLLTALLDRFPWLGWAGAGLLGWVAGEMIVSDPAVLRALAASASLVTADPLAPEGLAPAGPLHFVASTTGAVLVLALGYLICRRSPEPS